MGRYRVIRNENLFGSERPATNAGLVSRQWDMVIREYKHRGHVISIDGGVFVQTPTLTKHGIMVCERCGKLRPLGFLDCKNCGLA